MPDRRALYDHLLPIQFLIYFNTGPSNIREEGAPYTTVDMHFALLPPGYYNTENCITQEEGATPGSDFHVSLLPPGYYTLTRSFLLQLEGRKVFRQTWISILFCTLLACYSSTKILRAQSATMEFMISSQSSPEFQDWFTDAVDEIFVKDRQALSSMRVFH